MYEYEILPTLPVLVHLLVHAYLPPLPSFTMHHLGTPGPGLISAFMHHRAGEERTLFAGILHQWFHAEQLEGGLLAILVRAHA